MWGMVGELTEKDAKFDLDKVQVLGKDDKDRLDHVHEKDSEMQELINLAMAETADLDNGEIHDDEEV